MNVNLVTIILLFVAAANSTIVLDGNGYSNIFVAISEDIPQPEGDGALTMIESIEVCKNIH